ncbi:hypothetical protein [Microcella sp.]|uniref:hypothetical protein n=1 Tax=Microcella sp. TaxID=1913979 RepID=UPI00299F82A2|nr:hypothetical protein [Microcella sp.]MDX2025009.1 hypothetical protein [Microcella sp.]
MIAQRLLVGSVALVLMGTLAACAPEPEPVAEEPTPTPTETVEETATPEPEELTFTMPVDCTTILPQARLDAFATQSLELLGGPGSVYGNDYFFEPTPEQLAGGISCVYAQDGVDLSSILIGVAPVSTANRATIITDLTSQGLNEATTADGALTYSQQGDEGLAPAIYNVVTQESWISVISGFGGPAFYDEAVALAGDVATQVYQ